MWNILSFYYYHGTRLNHVENIQQFQLLNNQDETKKTCHDTTIWSNIWSLITATCMESLELDQDHPRMVTPAVCHNHICDIAVCRGQHFSLFQSSFNRKLWDKDTWMIYKLHQRQRVIIQPQTYHHFCLLLSDIDSNVVRCPPPPDNLDSDCHLWYLTLVCCVNNIDILTLVSVGKIPHFLSHDFLTFIHLKISNKQHFGGFKFVAWKIK